MIDEVDAENILDNKELFIMLKKLFCCWISFTEPVHHQGVNLAAEYSFQYEYLTILFRNASHISTIIRNNIDRELDDSTFQSKSVRLPGCFTAAQTEIPQRYFTSIEDVLRVGESEEFQGNGFTDTLIVVLALQLPPELSLDELKERWNATEVVHCGNRYELSCISGSEFQSVWLIINCSEAPYIKDEHLTLVVSRAQYEVGIILINLDQSEFKEGDQMLSSYLSLKKSDHVALFEQFIGTNNKKPTPIDNWLQPTDTDRYQFEWWERRMRIQLKNGKDRTMECVNRQPATVRLQLYFAFPSLFPFKGKIGSLI